jgi:hypothetical protein
MFSLFSGFSIRVERSVSGSGHALAERFARYRPALLTARKQYQFLRDFANRLWSAAARRRILAVDLQVNDA